ncbi:MAG: response regulator [Bdellovibrionales bacterium]|nr:response regulator [Bdellovibrionales bacterium]
MFPVDSKILIVDDSSFARTILKNSLREMKYWKILEAQDSKSAQDVLVEAGQIADPVHLVIADIHMPEYSGLQLLKWIREREGFKSLPVIILTSSQDKGDILEAGKLGASHFIIKPFDAEALRDRLAATWAKHGLKYVESLPRANK